MSGTGAPVAWPLARAGEALAALAERSRLLDAARVPPPYPRDLEVHDLAQWLEDTAGWLGVEAVSLSVRHREVESVLANAGPVLLTVTREPGLVEAFAVLDAKGAVARLVGSDLEVHRVPVSLLRDALCAAAERPIEPEVERMLDRVGIAPRRKARARRGLIAERIGWMQVSVGGLLRHRQGEPGWRQATAAGVDVQLALLLVSHALQYALGLLGWWMIARGALSGRMDRAWLLAWMLLTLSVVPLRLVSSWTASLMAIKVGTLFKQRLFAGAMALDAARVRRGIGQLFGQVIESSAVETLGIGGGFRSLLSLVELMVAAAILLAWGSSLLPGLLLLGWLAFTGWLGHRYYRRRIAWTDARLRHTQDVVERMVGHRTRLAQEWPTRWHDGEDHQLDAYLEASRRMDAAEAVLTGFAPRGWLTVGMAGLIPAFASGSGTDAAALAVSLGGVLLAYQGLRRLTLGLSQLAGALVAWREAAPMFHAAADVPLPGSPEHTARPRSRGVEPAGLLLDASALGFRHPAQADAVLKGCSLEVRARDRLLLVGPSGSGKSTLASLLVGLRTPSSGVLLFRGLDRQTLGNDGWRRRVAAAPQFHENHVLAGTFAFNLLLGRAWPPPPEDLREADRICRELDLGPLIDRMPAGLQQLLGETGWQLSHGERSRLFIARALLQEPDVMVLDESFGALDPETLDRALGCVLRRANALLVIAHP